MSIAVYGTDMLKLRLVFFYGITFVYFNTLSYGICFEVAFVDRFDVDDLAVE